ncbi:uncharacterized protein DS421_18g621020 [Arachis hypogaea]|nr:uncharacterized protein DS421_18g621020 [Arachis hypogaea]
MESTQLDGLPQRERGERCQGREQSINKSELEGSLGGSLEVTSATKGYTNAASFKKRSLSRFFNLPVIVPFFIVRHCHRLTRLLIVLSRALPPFIHLAALPCKVVKTLASIAPPSISPSPLVALKVATRFVVLEVPRSVVRQCLLSSPVSQFFAVVLRRVCRQLAVFEGPCSVPKGSDIYQETLAKALAKHFGARLLIVDSLSLPGGTPSKEVDSAKESSKPERPSVLAKRSTHAASLKHSKPASSVDAEIVGGSTISSQAMLKQEVSTASSKGTTIKTGDRVKFVGNFPSAVSSIQNHPSRVMLLGGRAPEYLAHDPLVALVIKLFSSGKALASICLGQLILAAAGVAKDHKFTAFPPVKPAPVASGAHWVEPDTSNSGGW